MRSGYGETADVGSLIYALCAAAALGCAVLLLTSYRKSGVRLLLWSGLCFASLTINNLLTGVDLVLLPTQVDLFLARNFAALVGMLFLLYGLIFDSR